jgi:DNA-binding NarL/FixJ family response regulator
MDNATQETSRDNATHEPSMDNATREQTLRPPRVLLARLSPVAAVGMRRMLSDEGVEIVGEEARPLAIEALAREVEPDAVVLDLGAGGARLLCDRIRLAAPNTTVILWASEENRMRIVGPGAAAARDVAGGDLADLRRELIASQSRPTEE